MTLPELIPNPELASLLADCETACERDCCGIDAFDFSPLNVAAHLSRYSGTIDTAHTRRILEDLERLLAGAVALPAGEGGLVCAIARTNQYFSVESLRALTATIRWAVQCAPLMLERSHELEKSRERGNA